MAALAHSVLKMVRKLGRGVGLPGPALAAAATAKDIEDDLADVVMNSAAPSRCFLWPNRLISGPAPALQ